MSEQGKDAERLAPESRDAVQDGAGLTHAALVERAARWLATTERCVFVMAEPVCYSTREIPDAIGWQSNGLCIVVECKVSVADFRADKAKAWRRNDGQGLGARRYYMTEPGLLASEIIPIGWGLLEAGPTVRRRHPSALFRHDHGSEAALLLNAVRRCHADPRISNHLAPFRHIEPEPEGPYPKSERPKSEASEPAPEAAHTDQGAH